MFENLEAEQEAMRIRQAARRKANRVKVARKALKQRPNPGRARKPRRRRDPLNNAIRLLRWRLRKAIAAGTLAPETDLSKATLRKQLLRERHARNSIRSWRRKAKEARSERWSAIKSAKAERREGIEQRKAERASRRQQEEQFRRDLHLKKPKTKQVLAREQEIALAYARGYQDGVYAAYHLKEHRS
jgi:hypothetical protein